VEGTIFLAGRVGERNLVEKICSDCILESESLFRIEIAVKNLRAAYQE